VLLFRDADKRFHRSSRRYGDADLRLGQVPAAPGPRRPVRDGSLSSRARPGRATAASPIPCRPIPDLLERVR
jgi:hypothetical protein